MTRPQVTYPDVERIVVDLLAASMPAPTTVGVNLPADWTAGGSDPHIQVSWDGTPGDNHPITLATTIRLVAWTDSKTTAKALAMEAHGRLLSYSGGDDAVVGLVNILPLTGPLNASDPDHLNAELCSVTVRATVISTPLT